MGGSKNGKSVRVLVVDDDPDIVKVLRVILRTHGFEVLEATSGMTGLIVAKIQRPDVVLLDIMMPDVDGFEVCRKMKLDSETKDIPVIFVSAKTGQEHLDRGLSLGAQGYVTKPFNLDALVKKINEVTGGD